MCLSLLNVGLKLLGYVAKETLQPTKVTNELVQENYKRRFVDLHIVTNNLG